MLKEVSVFYTAHNFLVVPTAKPLLILRPITKFYLGEPDQASNLILKNPVIYTKLGLCNLLNSATFDLSDIEVNSFALQTALCYVLLLI